MRASGPWLSAKTSKSFLESLPVHNKKMARRRAELLGIWRHKKMSYLTGNPQSTWVNVVSTTTASTNTVPFYIGGAGGGGATNGCGGVGGSNGLYGMQQAALQQGYLNQTATQQQAGINQGIYSNPTPQFIPVPTSPDMAEDIVKQQGHVVLRKAYRAIHTRLIHAHGGLARISTDHLVPKPLVREVHGYALPQQKGDYVMPDGSVLCIDDMGNYQIEDLDAKVTYRANRAREWNPYISASDLLEKFVDEIGKHPLVTQTNVLRLPVGAFVNWLINQAAKQDGDRVEGLPTVEQALLAAAA